MSSKLTERENLEVLNWLTPIDYGPEQSDFLERRQEGTGVWLLQTDQFRTWLDRKKKTLFCSGIPGAGKTILTSVVVDYLGSKYQFNSGVGIAYLYCSFRRQQQQKPHDLLLSLLKQLLQKLKSVPENVKSLYGRHTRERTRPLFTKILETFKAIAAGYRRLFIVVDALDECGISRNDRQKFLSAIFDVQGCSDANIFVTSRINDEIVDMFENAIYLEIRATEEDVRSYLDKQMSLQSSDILDDDLRDSIVRKIVRSFNGM